MNNNYHIRMDFPKLKERAYSLASGIEQKHKRAFDSSPEIRPEETGDVPPPISLSPSVLENSLKIKELLLEKEQDQHLINVLKKHCFEQSKEIEKLKRKIETIQQDYENLIKDTSQQPKRRHSIIETAMLARSRSESLNV